MATSQCSVLFVNATSERTAHAAVLRALGFAVLEAGDLPPNGDILNHHVVVLSLPASCQLTGIATRLRAQPRFGRRILIALVPDDMRDTQCRDGIASGFDSVLRRDTDGRTLAAAIVKGLRHVPEYRCMLRPITRRRKAA
jgi:hypothetical protein